MLFSTALVRIPTSFRMSIVISKCSSATNITYPILSYIFTNIKLNTPPKTLKQ
jgi:hypothetical protein